MTLQPLPSRLVPAFALLATFSPDANAETFRCGSRIISTDTTAAEILQICGKPDSETSKTDPVRTRGASGLLVVVGETTTKKWVYARGTQAQAMVVTIVDGKVKSIERQR